MSIKKILMVMLTGVAFAAAVCIIVGACIYFPALATQLVSTDPNYAALAEGRAAALKLGLLIMIVGGVSLLAALLALTAATVAGKLSKDNQ